LLRLNAISNSLSRSRHIAFNGGHLTFGYDGASKFADVRLSLARSYLIDCLSYEDLLTNNEALAAEGNDLDTRLSTWLGPNSEGFWLEPFKSEFGPNYKYLQADDEEAPKSLAAGLSSGYDTGLTPCRTRWLPAARRHYADGPREGSIRLTAQAVDHNSSFEPNTVRQLRGNRGRCRRQRRPQPIA
jgi:hypothetical protein